MSKSPVLRLLSGFSFLVLFAAALILFAGAPRGAMAQAGRGGMPGDFDYYVLALSWSPTFCSGQGRGDGDGRGGSDGAYGEDRGYGGGYGGGGYDGGATARIAGMAAATAAVDMMAGATARIADMAAATAAAVDTMAGATAAARDMAGGIPMSNAAE